MTSDERPWLASYPKGVPAEIDPSRYRSVAALLAECCERFRHRPAFFNMGQDADATTISTSMSAALASYLLNDLKLAQAAIASRSCCRTCCSIRSRSWPCCAPA